MLSPALRLVGSVSAGLSLGANTSHRRRDRSCWLRTALQTGRCSGRCTSRPPTCSSLHRQLRSSAPSRMGTTPCTPLAMYRTQATGMCPPRSLCTFVAQRQEDVPREILTQHFALCSTTATQTAAGVDVVMRRTGRVWGCGDKTKENVASFIALIYGANNVT